MCSWPGYMVVGRVWWCPEDGKGPAEGRHGQHFLNWIARKGGEVGTGSDANIPLNESAMVEARNLRVQVECYISRQI